MPMRVVPGSFSGQSAGSPHPALPHTTCAPGYSDTSSWRRPRSADETGCARESSAVQMSTRSRSWRRNTSSPLSAPVRPLLPIWPTSHNSLSSFFKFSFDEITIIIIKKYKKYKVKASAGQSFSSGRGSSSLSTPGGFGGAGTGGLGEGGTHADYQEKRILVRSVTHTLNYNADLLTPSLFLGVGARRIQMYNYRHVRRRLGFRCSARCDAHHPSINRYPDALPVRWSPKRRPALRAHTAFLPSREHAHSG
jgi:hypothetical protein